MDTHPPRTAREKSKSPAKQFRWQFWAILIFLVALVLSLVPALGRSGPTREAECQMSQESIEWLAKDITTWEKAHPSLPLMDLDDIQKNYLEQKYTHAESSLFVAHLVDSNNGFNGAWLGRLLQRPESHLHREPPKPAEREARISVLFQFSRGRNDEPKELHSWERTPMDEYMRFAKRTEITKTISIVVPIFIICAFVGLLGAIVINGLASFVRGAFSKNKT